MYNEEENKLRFVGMIMRVKLSDVTKYLKGTQINGDDLIENGEYIYLNGGINPSGRWNTANVKGNTVTISEGGNSSGYVNYVTEPFWCGAHCYYLFDGPKNTRYLYYALKSQQERLFDIRSGACMPNIKKADLGKFEFEFDTNEQKQSKIVSVLSKIEVVIGERKRELELLDELIKARFIELFGDPILNPYGWAVVTIGDIVTDVRYGTSKPAVEGGKYPYLRMNNLTYDGHLDLSDMKYIDIPDNEIEKCIVRKGDILFNRTNSIELVGKTCLFDWIDDMVIAGYIIRVRLNEKLLPIVLSSYMNLPSLKEQLRSMAKGAVNQANINAQELQSIKIYLPPQELQEQFAAFVAQTDKSKVAVQKALDEAQLLFDSLMQEYFG